MERKNLSRTLYAGLIASGLIGTVGCDYARVGPKKEMLEENLAKPVASFYSFSGSRSPSITIGDMNGDKRPDIVACGESYTGPYFNIYVLLNNGDGTYTSQTPAVKAELDEEDFKKKFK